MNDADLVTYLATLTKNTDSLLQLGQRLGVLSAAGSSKAAKGGGPKSRHHPYHAHHTHQLF